ncbi:RNA polymerase [Aspergillus sclerotialis]|uniref:RNA-dependent RNA polymerase n=1 Tax=Aspergillus sclerotialis TaxID=2070753 RepID=A0A3A2ZEI9_9EURO|nr:RNA polymerase [Aspergillus sclerotialis]
MPGGLPNRGRGGNSTASTSRPAPMASTWEQWESVGVKLGNVPGEVNSLTIWHAFSREGTVSSVELYEDSQGRRDGKGKVWFSPPPRRPFWTGGHYTISLPGGQSFTIKTTLDTNRFGSEIASPACPQVRYPKETSLDISAIAIGVLLNKETFMPMRVIGKEADKKFSLTIDLSRKQVLIYFPLANTEAPETPGVASSVNQYRINIPFTLLSKIFQTHDQSGRISHFAVLESPPLYYRRIKNIENTFVEETSWREADSWFRQTSIVHNPEKSSSLPVSLHKANAVIDIGRWTVFKITFPNYADKNGKFSMMCRIFEDYNIPIEKTDQFKESEKGHEGITPVWKWIDLPETQPSTGSFLDDLVNQTYIHLPFEVRYQLEVCMSNGYLSEFTMTREFAVRLSELEKQTAKELLEHIATEKKVYYDPMDIFHITSFRRPRDSEIPKIPAHCCHMRSAQITPSTVYYNTPSVDISNRVIRKYIGHEDRFLRVRFTDEKCGGRISGSFNHAMDEVFTRIKRALVNGIVIGDRWYEFLAFGNSQFREHGAYFFSPTPTCSAANIRAWMGDFDDIRNIAKYSSRLGLSFSTTRAINGFPVEVKNIPDIERNGYTFSDGVGIISEFSASMVMSELRIKHPQENHPLHSNSVSEGAKECSWSILMQPNDIIRWSQFSAASLNRQIIIVLSSLGIKDDVFHAKLKTMVAALDEAMVNDFQAIHLLKKYVDPNQMTLTISQMVLDGFRKSNEPFVTSILKLWRAWQLKYLKEKAKITLDQGACLLGCMDEIGVLKGQFNDNPGEDASYEEKLAALPEIFVQVCRHESNKYEVIEGLCIVARNPSLHPGDIRVVRAVNVKELKHLRDVVVFPQTGDRDIPSMCAGGDLDGDDYLVIWDPDLIPDDWFRTPMRYVSQKANELNREVTVNDVTSFFVTYMQNDCLGRIAHAHLAWADRFAEGVDSKKCMELAKLHSDAVDYNKTGVAATMTRSLTPKQWPHFMEKKGKAKFQIYQSKKILGQLYDSVDHIDYAPSLEMAFDEKILNCQLEVPDELVQFARDLKAEYDSAMRRIMALHEINTEFEVWSTFVLSHANLSNDYKFHETMRDISASLQDSFRRRCYSKVGGHGIERIGPLAVAMYRVTREEMAEALETHRKRSAEEAFVNKSTHKAKEFPFISFPWILSNILGKIALGHYELPRSLIDDTLVPDIKPGQNISGEKRKVHTKAASVTDAPGASGVNYDDQVDLLEDPIPSSSRCHPSPAKVGEPFSDPLADFDLDEKQMVMSPTKASTEDRFDLLSSRSSPKRHGAKESMKENVKPEVVEEGECGEIVEEEGDLQPNALDLLTQLLES